MFDCAACYANENEIGQVFKNAFDEGIVERRELFIMSKVWNDMHERVEESCRKSITDLQCEYLDLFFIHWPFPNYHAPGCDGDARNPDSKPFNVAEFVNTYRKCEELLEKGLIRNIGISNMTIPKLKLDSDIADIQTPQMQAIAKAHGLHPAVIALKWAVQRGQIPIPFSIHETEYISNLKSTLEDLLTEAEMTSIASLECNNRLVKGRYFYGKVRKTGMIYGMKLGLL